MHMSGTKQYMQGSWPISRFTPVLGVLSLLVLALVAAIFLTELHEEGASALISNLCWRNATVRPPVLLVLIVGGWGYVVRVGRGAGLDLDRVLGGRLLPP